MPKAKTRFKLDAMIKQNVATFAIANTNGDLDPTRRTAAIKKLSPTKASREMLVRIMERVERI